MCSAGDEYDPDCWDSGFVNADGDPMSLDEIPCPYGGVGQHSWVKETHKFNGTMAGPKCTYRADGTEAFFEDAPKDAPAWLADDNHWRPSIFMPRWASRITLKITSRRIARLQEISEEDAIAEGTSFDPAIMCEPDRARRAYKLLWESINGPGSWDKNSFVWVIGFEVIYE
jgi:hypothetical protein